MRRLIQLFLMAALASAAICRADVFHVSLDGDDNGSGNADHPFQTISRAARIVQAGDVVMIHPGIYRESVELTASGTPEKPITFEAQKPGTAIISGADPLTLWTAIRDHPGQYATDWPYDFIIDTNADGSPVRNHGAPAPIGCAEQILWQSHPLRQVMNPDDLSPGCFFVDWKYHVLTLWLPGGIDPRNTQIEGSVRQYLVTPQQKYNVFADSRYVTLRGLVCRDAANFAQRGGLILGTGWQMYDCIVENDNAGGISLNGNNILVKNCTAQFNGFCGISGSGNNNTLDGCIVRGNNRKGFPPDWEGGGGKFVQTDHLRVIHHLSYENTGPGLWLDIENKNYSITDSIFYGNRGLDADWEGAGIFLEISPGPGIVSNNIVYSNTGAGINLAESQHITVEGNTLVDNGAGIELRAMANRGNDHLQFISIARNRFKEWRAAAIRTSLGDWSPQSVADRSIHINGDVFDPPRDLPFIVWGDSKLAGLDDIRSALNLESAGSVQAIEFTHILENIRSVQDKTRPTISGAMKTASVGGIVTLPANSRSLLGDGQCAVFDQDGSCVALNVPTPELRDRLNHALAIDPGAAPVMLDVKVEQIQPHGNFTATLLAVH